MDIREGCKALWEHRHRKFPESRINGVELTVKMGGTKSHGQLVRTPGALNCEKMVRGRAPHYHVQWG